MAAIRARATNITLGGQRQRFLKGVGGLAVAIVAAVVFVMLDVSPGWLGVLFVPFWFGALGLIQAREKT